MNKSALLYSAYDCYKAREKLSLREDREWERFNGTDNEATELANRQTDRIAYLLDKHGFSNMSEVRRILSGV